MITKPNTVPCMSLTKSELASTSTVLRSGCGCDTTGTLPSSKVDGHIYYLGNPLKGKKSFELVKDKLAMVPEGRGVFTRMSIQENLLMGAYTSNDKGQIQADIDRWFEVFPRLKERAAQMAGTLSGGEQQMLAMARALMSHPKLLLLDEPSMGLSPIMVEKIFEVIRNVSAQGITILLVEQNAKLALSLADYGYIMESGRIVLDGTPERLLANDDVSLALGEGEVIVWNGDILVDQRFFDGETTPPAFDQRPNEWAYFRAPVSAVALNENTVTMTVRPGAEGAAARGSRMRLSSSSRVVRLIITATRFCSASSRSRSRSRRISEPLVTMVSG